MGLTADATMVAVAGIKSPNGDIIEVQQRLTVGTAGDLEQVRFPLNNGELVYVFAYTDDTSLENFDLYASIGISLGSRGSVDRQFYLCEGWITSGAGIAWPKGNAKPASVAFGKNTVISIPNPGAGNPVAFTFPRNSVFLLKNLQFNLITDATVASRTVFFTVTRSAVDVVTNASVTVQSAASTKSYFFVKQMGSRGTSTSFEFIPMGDITALSGDILNILPAPFPAGDQITVIRLTFEERVIVGV